MYAYVVTEDHIIVIDTDTGRDVKFFKGEHAYEKALELIRTEDYEEVFDLDVKNIVTSFFEEYDDTGSVSVTIENGVGKLTLHNYDEMKVDLADAITKKILKMYDQGFDCLPLMNFIANLYENPSQTAIEELYGFIEACDLPITEDGYFIAYKIVRNDYKDIYTGKMDNSVGTWVEIPRGLVDDNRNNTCSRGLHFCSKEYLNSYGSSVTGDDRCMLVKINPANVVSIPSDYNNAKGRAACYEVVGELPAGWRKVTPEQDYTDRVVVDRKGKPKKVSLTYQEISDIVDSSAYDYESISDQWYDYSGWDEVSVDRKVVKEALGVEYDDLDTYQNGLDNISEDEYNNFGVGYIDGYDDGRIKISPMHTKESTSIVTSSYANGYVDGYKDGKNKKKKLIKKVGN